MVTGTRMGLLERPPPAALRFAYAGAAAHESAVLHGLAAAYEGLFRLETDFPVHGRAAYRHVLKPDKWIAFNGTGWMAQHESALGSRNGVLLLCDASCATPDQSTAVWKVTPSWKPEPGLQCVGMTAEEARVASHSLQPRSSHHPPLYAPTRSSTSSRHPGRRVRGALQPVGRRDAVQR